MPQTPFQHPIWRHLLAILVLLWVGSLLFGPFAGPEPRQIAYSTFKQQVSQGKVATVTFEGEQIRGRYKTGSVGSIDSGSSDRPAIESPRSKAVETFVTTKPQLDDPKLLEMLEKQQVTIEAEAAGGPWWARVLLGFLPWVLILGLFFYLSYRMQQRISGGGDGPGGIFGFAKSNHRHLAGDSFTSTGRSMDYNPPYNQRRVCLRYLR
jgi:cell division protease FtsH